MRQSKQTRQLIKALKINKAFLLGAGMFSVVTEHTGVSVLKHTICPAFPEFIENPMEDQLEEPFFVRGSYVSSRHVFIDGYDYMACTYELPKLRRVAMKDMSSKQRRIVRDWKQFLVRTTASNQLHRYRQHAEELVEEIFDKYEEPFKINLINLIRSLDNDYRLDTAPSNRPMLNAQDQLVIFDPVFCRKTSYKLTPY